MTVHIATVHHRDARFLDLQLDALHQWTDEPYEVWAVLDGVEDERVDHVVRATETQHGPRLDRLAATIIAGAKPDDLILFLDGDAWPIADWLPTVTRLLADNALVAVRRDESPAGPWPHPLFCATTVIDWAGLRASWRPETWADPTVKLRYDVGAGVGRRLLEDDLGFHPLLRLNRHNPHPLFFGVYGDLTPLVYHHGAGFRPKYSLASRPGDTIEALQALSDDILDRARRDPGFWRNLLEVQ